jgi:hypothetical protein
MNRGKLGWLKWRSWDRLKSVIFTVNFKSLFFSKLMETDGQTRSIFKWKIKKPWTKKFKTNCGQGIFNCLKKTSSKFYGNFIINFIPEVSTWIQQINLFINQFAEIARLKTFKILFDGARPNWFLVSSNFFIWFKCYVQVWSFLPLACNVRLIVFDEFLIFFSSRSVYEKVSQSRKQKKMSPLKKMNRGKLGWLKWRS